jgi:Domain of unknown function (DUF4340)
MRSLGFTIILALLAALVCGLVGWQLREGNFNAVFGAPPTGLGERLYTACAAGEKKQGPGFDPAEVRRILISQNGVKAEFERSERGWQCIAPWKDRMDPHAAMDIIKFTLGMRVEDVTGVDKIDPQKTGLNETSVNIRLEGKNQESLARYKLGRVTPWQASFPEVDQLVPTVFVQPRDPNHKRYVYVCTGDIGPWFRDGLKYLRDHQPFYFSPLNLQSLRILNGQDELTLARETLKSPWRVTKPQSLATDPKAMKALIEGLFHLRAVKVTDSASVTVAPVDSVTKPGQIAMTSFGSEGETVLTIFPPETADTREVRATVSDRPGSVFQLLLKPEPAMVSLTDLPRTLNELRDGALMNLNIQTLSEVRIQPANGSEILVSRTLRASPKAASGGDFKDVEADKHFALHQPWQTTIDGHTADANEECLFTLLKAVTTGRALSFPTDAATDFTPWGLDKPFLKLHFLSIQGQEPVVMNFGRDRKGDYFVNRTGTTTVMQIDPSLVSSIPVNVFEWRNSRVWSLDRNNLKVISRKLGEEPPLTLLYDFTREEWSANRNAKDLTAVIVPTRANFLLGILEGLRVTRWLSPDDVSANAALAHPLLAFKIIETTTDDTLEETGTVTRELQLAAGTPGPRPAFYYGRLLADGQPFLLDRESYQKLTMELLEKE